MSCVTCHVYSYLESLVDYMENYALRIRPLLDVNEVSCTDSDNDDDDDDDESDIG